MISPIRMSGVTTGSGSSSASVDDGAGIVTEAPRLTAKRTTERSEVREKRRKAEEGREEDVKTMPRRPALARKKWMKYNDYREHI